MLKQVNTTDELNAIRIYQCMAVFLHIYTFDKEYLYATLLLFYTKLAEKSKQPK